MKLVDDAFIEELIAEAETSPRRRAHRNLHSSPEDPVQRFCMAAFPGSYCRPHRHTGEGRWEAFIALRGAASVLTFSDEGQVTGKYTIRGGGPARIAEVPPAAWHTVVVLEEKTVLFEVKPGPYVPSSDKDFASWAPAEGSGEAGECEQNLRKCSVGDSIPRG